MIEKKKRIVTKIGDIFQIKVDDIHAKYFQYIANDKTELNSDVIRVFKKKYPINEEVDPEVIVEGEVEFYAHCVVPAGVKMGLWTKYGKSKKLGTMDIFFRGTNDYGYKIGEAPMKYSNNWYIWKINEPFQRVGSLAGVQRKFDIGLIFTPKDIYIWASTGKIPLVNYPGFE